MAVRLQQGGKALVTLARDRERRSSDAQRRSDGAFQFRRRFVDPSYWAGLRDRALLFLGFDDAFRRSEMVALVVVDPSL